MDVVLAALIALPILSRFLPLLQSKFAADIPCNPCSPWFAFSGHFKQDFLKLTVEGSLDLREGGEEARIGTERIRAEEIRDGEMGKTSFRAFCVKFYADHVGKTGPEVCAASKVARLVAGSSCISEDEALDRFCQSATAENLADGKNGFYGQSALFIFGQCPGELAVA